MSKKRQMVPIAGLFALLGVAVYMVVQLNGARHYECVTGDFTNAAVAEVKDAQGQMVLQGQFDAVPQSDDEDTERKATLKPTGIDADAERRSGGGVCEGRSHDSGDRVLRHGSAAWSDVHLHHRWAGHRDCQR